MVLLDKLIVAQLVENFSVLTVTRSFITVSTRDATGPYPEPDRSSPKILFNIILLLPNNSYEVY